MQVFTMEILRWVELSFNTIMMVKILRTTTAPSGTFTTAASFSLTKGTKEGYGKQRLFHSLAWGSGALIAGYLIDTYGLDAIFWYTYLFNVCSFSLVVFGLKSTYKKKIAEQKKSSAGGKLQPEIVSEGHIITESIKDVEMTEKSISAKEINESENAVESNTLMVVAAEEDAKTPKHPPAGSSSPASIIEVFSRLNYLSMFTNYLWDFKDFFVYKPSQVLLINALLYGFAMIVPDNFLTISLENDFGASRTFNGWCATLSTLACLPVFYYSDDLIRKYGHHNCILFSELLLILR
jgi:hypothetical protein